jgi:YYY domain-containing protein
MLRRRTVLLFLLAFVLRLLLQGWDSGVTGSSSHPDERQVGFVTQKAEGWFANPDFYAYGSLHFQAIRIVATVIGQNESLRGLILSGRLISLLASMLAIFFGWLIVSRAWGRRTGDLFILLAAWVPLDLQQSHFTTVEAHHSAWVMAALAACFWLARGGRPVAAALTGAAIGASLAVKVASLALGLPLVVAIVLAGRGRGVLASIRLLAIAGAAGIFGFWLCQPWAFANGRPPLTLIVTAIVVAVITDFAARQTGRARAIAIGIVAIVAVIAAVQGAALVGIGGESLGKIGSPLLAGTGLNPKYLEGVGNEIAMVVGRSDLAYVRIYAHTLPILYPLRELAFWGWGALLLAAVLCGSVAGGWHLGRRWKRWLGGRWNESSMLLVIILTWIVPMTLRLSTLQVKFLRYWEPLVVPAAMIGAWWLARLPKQFRLRATRVVVAGTVLWGMAYAWSFIEPHPHKTASTWISPMLAEDQVVAFEHWDEHIELHPVHGGLKRVELPSYELPDEGNKIALWTDALASADWVVLTSNRVYRTVLANPDRFPQTARLYRLLLSGEAGFEILTKVRRGPRIFGLRWPVQRADESYLNYEFPQVLILRRVAEIDPNALANRIARPLPYLEQMDYADFEREFLNQVPATPPVPSRVRQLFDLVTWLIVFSGFGIAAWIFLLPVIRGWPDAGVGLALATGWIVPAWLMWMGSELRIWQVSPATASWFFLGLVGGGATVAVSRWSTIQTIVRRRRSGIKTVLAVALAIGALFLVVRAWNPAIYWGEKPMDFSFLNSFIAAQSWPPPEPWLAGMPLHYYYFGEVLAAFPMLVAGCTPAVGYNLISATIPALFAGVLASIGLLLTRRRRITVAASVLPLLVLLTGNLAWPWMIKTWREGNIFDLWWATSRVIPGFAITEYPLWTTLFADLHGHFIAFPVLLMTFAWGWLSIEANDRKWIVSAVLCGIGAAVVVATNPWDLFIMSATLGVGVVVSARRRIRGLIRLAVAAAVSVVAAAPFIVELMAGFSAGTGQRGIFLTDADFAPAWAILRHFGLFVIPLAALAMVHLGRRFWIVLPTVAIGVVAGLRFDSSAAALALAVFAVFATVAVRSKDRLDRLGWSLAALALLVVAASERYTLIDRMNTIFKVYNGVWVLLAFALAAALMRARGKRLAVVITVWAPLQIIAMANLPIGIGQGWVLPRITSPRPTLDGQAFLATQDPETWFLARALQGAARPGDAIAEAAGPSYREFTRIAMHTGLQTVVGWDHHLKQRLQSPAEIEARFKDLETLYSPGNAKKRRAVLDAYGVAWAVVAKVERDRYDISTQDPLGTIPGVRLIAEHGGAAFYRVLPRGAVGAFDFDADSAPPIGMTPVGRLTDVTKKIIRSLDLGRDGASAILRNGALVDLDLLVQTESVLPSPPCEPTTVARRGANRWIACSDGRMWRLTQNRWRSIGHVRGAQQIIADLNVWAWGSGGLWLYREEGTWQPVFSSAVTAATAQRRRVAWSDGSRIWVGEGSEPRRVGERLDGVRALAWQGDKLWAIDATALYRAASVELPWRRTLEAPDEMVAIAGNEHSLWVVRADGLVFEPIRPSCPSPWDSSQEERSGSLREPRGLTVSPAGWFAVADTFNHRIIWYSDSGQCLDEIGSEGNRPGQFKEPSGLALAADGTMAVADTWNSRIQLFRPDGVNIVFEANLFGPRDLLWSGDGSLFVSDTGNKKLLRFRPPQWQSETVLELPGPPVGLAWAAGLIAVAVPADGAVFLINSSKSEVVRRIELPCWEEGDQQEGYLAVLPSGDLIASSPTHGQLWRVDPSGEEPPYLIEEGLPWITAIALTPVGDLLASVTWEHRLVRIPVED